VTRVVDASSAEIPAKDVRPRKNHAKRAWIDAEPQVEPIGGEALNDEAAGEGVQREQGRQLS